MKCSVITSLSALFLILTIQVYGQITYSCTSPGVGSWTACNNPTITGCGTNCSYTYYGPTTAGEQVLRLKVVSITGNSITFQVGKCNGSTFGAGTTFYLKSSTSSQECLIVCGTSSSGIDISSTTGTTYTYTASFTSGTTYFCGVVINSVGRFYSNKIAITATAATPNLQLWSTMSFGSSSLVTGSSYSFNTSIKNTGTGSWSGNLYLKQGSTDWLIWYSATINAGQILTLPTQSYSPSSAGSNLPITLSYQTGGSGTGVQVPAGSYSNPIYVTVCQAIAQPSLSTPTNSYAYSSVPGSITYNWVKNNNSGVATYTLKVRDITNDPVNGPILIDQNFGDVSTCTPTLTYSAAHTYRWVITAIGGCGQTDDSPAWTFSIAGVPNLVLSSPMSFGQSNLIIGTQYPFSSSVSNTGTGTFTGNLFLKQGSTVWINWYNVTINPGQSISLPSQSYSPVAAGTNLPLTLFYAPTGITTGTQVLQGSYSNPIYVTVCQGIAQPSLSSPSEAYTFTSVPSSITYSWLKNNTTGIATYDLKVRDITNDPVNGPILIDQDFGDVSTCTPTLIYTAAHTYRWVITAIGGCGQTDDSPAWTFSVAGVPNLVLSSAMSFGQSNLITGTPYQFSTSVSNTGTGAFIGNLYLKQGSTVWIYWYNITINPGQSIALPSQSYSPLTAGTALPLTLFYAPTGVTTGVQVLQGNYSNPIYVTVCQGIAQPSLSSPSDAYIYTSVPGSITYSWIKNNSTGVATYALKVRDITNDPVNGPILIDQDFGDVSTCSPTLTYIAAHTYRWVITAIGGCSQTDVSTAWIFSVAGIPNLVLWSSMSFGTTNLITGIPFPFTTSIKNTGTGTFTGNFYLKQSSTDWLIWYNITITPGEILSLPASNFTPSSAGNNLPVTLHYAATGVSTGTPVPQGSYSNPISVNVCQTISQPAPLTPANGYTYPNIPSTITFTWQKNNNSGLATYFFKIRDLTTNVIIHQQNYGDVSNCTPAISYISGHQYRWIVAAIGSCNQSDTSTAWTFNITSIPTLCQFSDCTSPTNCGDPSYQSELYTATHYLCAHNIVKGVNGAVLISNTDYITRGALAKIAFYGLFGDSTLSPSAPITNSYPNPYSDLQDPSMYYYTAAKFLLYLQYGDSITPFDRNRANFYPSGTIKRIHLLKVLLETFNIPKDNTGPSPFSDMSTSSEGYGYAHWAFDHGIATETTFSPNANCTRAMAFLFLYRILISSYGTPPAPNYSTDFFIPDILSSKTLAAEKSLETGNFNHYAKSSFAIPGRNVSLDFEHSYNSYLTELPEELFPIKPLGYGWSHSYNSYIIDFIAEVSTDNRWMVVWPDGSVNSYKYISGAYWRDTEGIYDTLLSDSPNQFRIETKNKMTYTFTKTSTSEVAWMLSSIIDRNNNAVTINYVAGPTYTDPNGVVKPTRKVSTVTDPAGRILTFFYTTSPASLLTKITDPLGRFIEFTFSSDLLSSFKDAKSQTTNYSYYTYGQGPSLLKEITFPLGNKITNTYKNRKLRYTKVDNNPGTLINLDPTNYNLSGSSNYLQSTVTDATGVIKKYDYNSKGKNTKVYGNATTDITTNYFPSGATWLPSSIVNNKTAITATMTYDPKGNPTHIITSGGGTTVHEYYQYNTFNDVTQYTDRRGNNTNYSYNSSGNLTQLTDQLGHPTSFTNNSYGQPTSITTPSNVVSNFGYNSYGNLNSTSIPALSLTSTMNFDGASRLTSSVNFANQSTSYLFDGNDNMTKETDALAHETNFFYDVNDNLTTITNAKNVPTTMTYDTYDRLTGVSFVGANKVYAYNFDGSVHTFTDPNNHVFTYSYDADGRITSDGYATYTYDPTTSNLKTVVKDSKTITYNYDGLNRISSINYSDFSGNTVSYTYDNNDNLLTIVYPGNKTVTYTYDITNRLSTVTDWNNAITTYTYRNDGQLLTTTYPNTVKCTNSYDLAGRMNGLEYKKNGGTGTSIASYSFTLDNLGNHTQEQITEPYSSYPGVTGQTINYTYNNANRIQTAGSTTFNYDNNGNTTSKTGYSYTCDIKNNITSIAGNYSQTYEYDGLGNRRKKGNTRYVLDILGMSQVLMETDLSGNVQNYYIYGLGLISRISSSNATNYYISDFRGSIVAMTDATTSATITNQYQYDDFGKITQFSEVTANPFRYVGKYGVMYDDSLNYFMRARYYDPKIGRFMSEDPVWGTNLFPYSNNNPIIFIDPSGLVTYKKLKKTFEKNNLTGPIYGQVVAKNLTIDISATLENIVPILDNLYGTGTETYLKASTSFLVGRALFLDKEQQKKVRKFTSFYNNYKSKKDTEKNQRNFLYKIMTEFPELFDYIVF